MQSAARSALLTQDRVLHNLAIGRGFQSFAHTPESGLTDRRLSHVSAPDKHLPVANGVLRDSYWHQSNPEVQAINGMSIRDGRSTILTLLTKSRPTGRPGMPWERDSRSRKFAGSSVTNPLVIVTNFYCRSHRNVQVRRSASLPLESFDVDRDCEVV
jgi:hypothetical protein